MSTAPEFTVLNRLVSSCHDRCADASKGEARNEDTHHRGGHHVGAKPSARASAKPGLTVSVPLTQHQCVASLPQSSHTASTRLPGLLSGSNGVASHRLPTSLGRL